MKVILWKKIVGLVTGLVFAILITGTVIAGENSGAISAALGAKTFEVIDNSDGETDPADLEYFPSSFDSLDELIPDTQRIAEQIEAEGAVLLKNDNGALPLESGERDVTLFGVTSVDPVYGGTGSGSVNTSTAPSFLTAFEESGMTVNPTVWNYYKDAVDGDWGRYSQSIPGGGWGAADGYVNEAPWSEVETAGSTSFATYGDAAIVVFGRVGGEGADMKETNHPDPDTTDGDYLQLTGREKTLLSSVAARKGTDFDRIIVLFNTANMIQADFLEDSDYGVDAALWIGGVGQVGLYAVADILVGDVNPSGHTSDTFWNDQSANPVSANFGVYNFGDLESFDTASLYGTQVGSPSNQVYTNYVVYQEGVYMGYRYTETRYEDFVMGTGNAGNFDYDAAVAFPFGFGLSYTEFEYSDFTVSRSGGIYEASVTVTNVGDVAGKDAVQFYAQKPYTQYDIDNGIEKPSVELVEFAKTEELAPDASQTVTVEIEEKYFASYDANNAGTYVLSAGDYYITVAHDAHDAVNNILAEKGFGVADGMTAAGNADLVTSYNLGFDDSTYSVSAVTGNAIGNLFDQADVNRSAAFGGQTVTYISRNNWTGTVSFDTVELNLTQGVYDQLAAQKLDPEEDDIAYPNFGIDSGLMLIDMRVDSEGNPIPFDDPVWDQFMDQLTWDEITYLLSTGLRKTGAIESIAKPETQDHNGPSGLGNPYNSGPLGLANRTDDPRKNESPMAYPTNGIVAATFNQELALIVGDSWGEQAIWAGYAGLYGTGANTHRSQYEGRAFEYYSEDPILGGKIIAQTTAGLQANGCYVYLKHFALNEQEANRIGINTLVNEQALREIYLRMFEIPIIEGGAKNVMTAFNRMGVDYAPLSDAAIDGFLRGEAGMDGFVVTDYYTNYGASMNRGQTLLAGNDLPDGDVSPSLLDVYEYNHGEVAQQMRLSAKRVLYTVVHSNAMNGISSDTQIVQLTPTWQVALITLDIVFGAAFAGISAWMVVDYFKKFNA